MFFIPSYTLSRWKFTLFKALTFHIHQQSFSGCPMWKSTKVRIIKRLCYAVYLTSFNARCFDFFYSVIIRQYELLKQSRSCTICELCHNCTWDLSFTEKCMVVLCLHHDGMSHIKEQKAIQSCPTSATSLHTTPNNKDSNWQICSNFHCIWYMLTKTLSTPHFISL